MKIYQVLKVTKEGERLITTRPMLKSVINWAKETVAITDAAPAEYQRTSKRKLKDDYFYASVRLMHDGYAINVEIRKTRAHHE